METVLTINIYNIPRNDLFLLEKELKIKNIIEITMELEYSYFKGNRISFSSPEESEYIEIEKGDIISVSSTLNTPNVKFIRIKEELGKRTFEKLSDRFKELLAKNILENYKKTLEENRIDFEIRKYSSLNDFI